MAKKEENRDWASNYTRKIAKTQKFFVALKGLNIMAFAIMVTGIN